MLDNFKIFLITALILSNSLLYAENLDKGKPVFLESDSAKWDEGTQRSTYRGNVVVTQGTILLTGDLLVVTSKNNAINRMEMSGNKATYKQKTDSGKIVNGEAKIIQYYLENSKIIFLNQAILIQSNNIVKSNKIIYKTDNENIIAGDKEGNWTYRRAKKAIRKAEAAGTFRLSKKQHKKLKGRGWSDKSKTSDLDTLRAKRVKQDRPGTLQSMKDMAKAVDAGEAPPAVATRHPKTGELTQHAGRTRHTASKLFGGKGAEFAVISAKDRHKALRSKLRKRRREQQGGHTREPIKQTKNPPGSGVRFDSDGIWG